MAKKQKKENKIRSVHNDLQCVANDSSVTNDYLVLFWDWLGL